MAGPKAIGDVAQAVDALPWNQALDTSTRKTIIVQKFSDGDPVCPFPIKTYANNLRSGPPNQKNYTAVSSHLPRRTRSSTSAARGLVGVGKCG
jgi:hypothetical protein